MYAAAPLWLIPMGKPHGGSCHVPTPTGFSSFIKISIDVFFLPKSSYGGRFEKEFQETFFLDLELCRFYLNKKKEKEIGSDFSRITRNPSFFTVKTWHNFKSERGRDGISNIKKKMFFCLCNHHMGVSNSHPTTCEIRDITLL